MALEAVLTVGWPELETADPTSAVTIHETCSSSGREKYQDTLTASLDGLRQQSHDANVIVIRGLEQLFRRRTSGFRALQQFLGQLNQWVADAGSAVEPPSIECEIDVFAYAFLKGAKNIDLFFPETLTKKGPYRAIESRLSRTIEHLEAFERDGKTTSETDLQAYLALRRVIARPSARDERRTLATLLVNGPSTGAEIQQDLGMPYSLGERILPTLQDIRVLTRREAAYVISEEALPRVVFGLREVMGVDLLPILD